MTDLKIFEFQESTLNPVSCPQDRHQKSQIRNKSNSLYAKKKNFLDHSNKIIFIGLVFS